MIRWCGKRERGKAGREDKHFSAVDLSEQRLPRLGAAAGGGIPRPAAPVDRPLPGRQEKINEGLLAVGKHGPCW